MLRLPERELADGLHVGVGNLRVGAIGVPRAIDRAAVFEQPLPEVRVHAAHVAVDAIEPHVVGEGPCRREGAGELIADPCTMAAIRVPVGLADEGVDRDATVGRGQQHPLPREEADVVIALVALVFGKRGERRRGARTPRERRRDELSRFAGVIDLRAAVAREPHEAIEESATGVDGPVKSTATCMWP